MGEFTLTGRFVHFIIFFYLFVDCTLQRLNCSAAYNQQNYVTDYLFKYSNRIADFARK